MSPPSRPSVFLTGGTGYVGGCYLNRLLASDSKPSSITVLSRRKETFSLIEGLSTNDTKVTALQGSFDDHDVLTKAASEHDITIEAGDSDNTPLVDALLKGMQQRKSDGKETTFIHVSGTGTLTDDARGAFKSETVYTDAKPGPPSILSVNDLSPSAFHRKIDLAIYEADKKGWCEAYLIFPGTIWGEGTGGVYDIGLSGKYSKQIPQQAQASIDRGRAGMVGEGLNVWAHVHIDDLASHFDVVYANALASKAHGYDGNYLAVAGEYQLLESTKWMAKTMHKHGWSKNDTPDSFSDAELDKYYGALEKIGGSKYYSGTNSRGISAQAEALGWKPKHTDLKEFYESYIVSETERIGNEAKSK